jgi:hypothetical protein
MRQIFGYVLILETNVGIPNLVVAAYDTGQPLNEIIVKHRTDLYIDPQNSI